MQLFALPSTFLAFLSPSLILLPAVVFADVQFTSPGAGSKVGAGLISVEWQESGIAPPITNLAAYTLTLMTGGNNEHDDMLALSVFVSQGYFTSGDNASGTIPTGIAEEVKNGFFFRITSSTTMGGEVINYSDRFSIYGLTGVTPSKYLNAATALNGSTAGPDSVGDDASSSTATASTTSIPTSTGTQNSRVVTVTHSGNSNPTTAPNKDRSTSSGSGISTGALAGIAIAGAVIGIIGIGLALWAFLRRRRVKEVAEIKLGSEDGNQSDDHLRREMSMATPSPPPVELDPSSTLVEAGDGFTPEMDSNIRAELEGDFLHQHCWDDEPLTPIPSTPLECLTLDSSMIPTPTMPGKPVQPRDNV